MHTRYGLGCSLVVAFLLALTSARGQDSTVPVAGVPASVSNTAFCEYLRAEVPRLARQVGLEAAVVRLLPTVNYAVIQCRLPPVLEANATATEANGTIAVDRLPLLVERLRVLLAAPEYAAYCAYNPRDPLPAEPNPLLTAGSLLVPPEIVPGELVLALNGKLIVLPGRLGMRLDVGVTAGGGIGGRVAVCNRSGHPVTVAWPDVAFAVDEAAVEVRWLPVTAAPLPAMTTPPVADVAPATVDIPPGGEAVASFMLVTEVAPGTHILAARLRLLDIQAAAEFVMPEPPRPPVNFAPLCRNARLDPAARMVAARHDPLVALTLAQEALRLYADGAGLVDVSVQPVASVLQLSGVIADARPSPYDLTVRLSFAGTPADDLAAPAIDRLLAAYAGLWFVARAEPMPQPGPEVREGGDGTADDSAPLPICLRQVCVGIVLRGDAAPRPVARVDVPVSTEWLASPQSDTVQPPPPARRFVAVAVTRTLSGSDGDAAGADQADFVAETQTVWLETFVTAPQVATALFTPTDTRAWFAVDVDPDNAIAEFNEADNACRLEPPAAVQAVFSASAWLAWPQRDALRAWENLQDVSLVVEGVLLNTGTEPVLLQFPSSLQMDFSWGDMYRWSDGRAFLDVLTDVTVAAGEARSWMIRVPLAEVWAKLRPADSAGRVHPFSMNLLVSLAGTEYRDAVPMPGVFHLAWLDVAGPAPDQSWEQRFAEMKALFDALSRPTPDASLVSAAFSSWVGEFSGHPEWTGTPLPQRLFALDLLPGWNLVSLPLQPVSLAAADLFGDAIQGPVWELVTDPEAAARGGWYQEADVLQPFTAYWVYAPARATVSVSGTAPLPKLLRLARGQNLCGLDYRQAGLPQNLPLDRQVWRWAADHQCYEMQAAGAPLVEGQGYWVNAREACELTVGGE